MNPYVTALHLMPKGPHSLATCRSLMIYLSGRQLIIHLRHSLMHFTRMNEKELTVLVSPKTPAFAVA